MIELESITGIESWVLKFNTPNDGLETITVPTFSKPGDFRIKIDITLNGASQVFWSNGLVRVNPPPSISATIPGGTDLKSIESQLASVADAFSRLFSSVGELLKK